MDTSTISLVALVVSVFTALAVILLLLAVILLLAVVLKRREIAPQDVSSAVSETWVRLRLGETIGRIEVQANDIRKTYTTLEQMLRSPTGRASFGELSLEVILKDQLPTDCFGIREKCVDGKIPDAHIKSPDGLICIDSKFPLENFAKRSTCNGTDHERVTFLKQFLKDAERHLKKVADDYVRPQQGTAAFAFVYIPSEAVYYVLATEGYDLLRKYVSLGVQVVSPLLMAHKLELLKLGIKALRLNENAQEVLVALQGLGKRFNTVEGAWRVFYSTHLRNLEAKAGEVDEAYKRLYREFQRIGTDLPPTAKEIMAEKTVSEEIPTPVANLPTVGDTIP
jgi:DNA recombination protein RmuC